MYDLKDSSSLKVEVAALSRFELHSETRDGKFNKKWFTRNKEDDRQTRIYGGTLSPAKKDKKSPTLPNLATTRQSVSPPKSGIKPQSKNSLIVELKPRSPHAREDLIWDPETGVLSVGKNTGSTINDNNISTHKIDSDVAHSSYHSGQSSTDHRFPGNQWGSTINDATEKHANLNGDIATSRHDSLVDSTPDTSMHDSNNHDTKGLDTWPTLAASAAIAGAFHTSLQNIHVEDMAEPKDPPEVQEGMEIHVRSPRMLQGDVDFEENSGGQSSELGRRIGTAQKKRGRGGLGGAEDSESKDCTHADTVRYSGGVNTREHRNGTFYINYDDAKSEIDVHEELISLAPFNSDEDRGAKIGEGGDTRGRRREVSNGGRAQRKFGSAKLSPQEESKALWQEGAQVEANYRCRGQWFKGKITRDRGSGLFDILYDDGDAELRVHENMIRKYLPSRLVVGMKVEANYRARGVWHSGVISQDRGYGAYDVAYDDGDTELRVSEEMIRVMESPASLRSIEAGSKVEANNRNRGKWYPGVITRDRGYGAFDVLYDDGDSEQRLRLDMIRLLDWPSQAHVDAKLDGVTGRSKVGAATGAGSKDEIARSKDEIARLKDESAGLKDDSTGSKGEGSGRFSSSLLPVSSPQRIASFSPLSSSSSYLSPQLESSQGQVTLSSQLPSRSPSRSPTSMTRGYPSVNNDNKLEISAAHSLTARAPLALTQTLPTNSPLKNPDFRVEEGMKVEANYRGRGAWLPGEVSRDRGDGTFDVFYSHGESEVRVREELIRVVGTADGPHGLGSPNVRAQVLDTGSFRPKKGSKVFACASFRAGKWCAGSIIGHRKDGTFDIAFEDGPVEKSVKENMIRLLEYGIPPSGSPRRIYSSSPPISPTFSPPLSPHLSPHLFPPRLEEGAKVSVDYRGRGDQLMGTIARVRSDGTFDVIYDNGESEIRVQERMIRLRDPEAANLMEGSLRSSTRHERGAIVEVNVGGRGMWCIATVSRTHRKGTYDVVYDNGETEYHVDECSIRSILSSHRRHEGHTSSRLAESHLAESHRNNPHRHHQSEQSTTVQAHVMPTVGMRVEANYRGKGKWYAGKVSRKRSDDTFDILYDDGESELAISPLMIRSLDSMGHSVGGETDTAKLRRAASLGSAVEVNYRGRGKWFPATISKDRGDGTFDIAYDDGEIESGVREIMIRLRVSNSVSSSGTSNDSNTAGETNVKRASRVLQGAKVEANFRGRGKWFTGTVTRDYGDGTYDIAYDDGESEILVAEDMIRLLGEGLIVGARVEVRDQVTNRWLPGRIIRSMGDGTFDVAYVNGNFVSGGELEEGVRGDLIRLVSGNSASINSSLIGGTISGPPLKQIAMQSKVEDAYSVKRVEKDAESEFTRDFSSFHVESRENDDNKGILQSSSQSKPLAVSPRSRAALFASKESYHGINEGDNTEAFKESLHGIHEGDIIEANHCGRGTWLLGRVSRKRSDGTFDVAYDMGDMERRIPFHFIRNVAFDAAQPKNSNDHIARGGDKGREQSGELQGSILSPTNASGASDRHLVNASGASDRHRVNVIIDQNLVHHSPARKSDSKSDNAVITVPMLPLSTLSTALSPIQSGFSPISQQQHQLQHQHRTTTAEEQDHDLGAFRILALVVSLHDHSKVGCKAFLAFECRGWEEATIAKPLMSVVRGASRADSRQAMLQWEDIEIGKEVSASQLSDTTVVELLLWCQRHSIDMRPPFSAGRGAGVRPDEGKGVDMSASTSDGGGGDSTMECVAVARIPLLHFMEHIDEVVSMTVDLESTRNSASIGTVIITFESVSGLGYGASY